MKYVFVFAVTFLLGLLIFFGYENIEILKFNGIFTLFYVFDLVTRYILPWLILDYLIKIARK
ncbi:hypothetical protein [Alkalihalobacterium alkalinitrilicum]|uniref:hypothetical protein n=1 Tax=Alkalihalobacterium alkalinitrilicum TaxID=427920 RepID=UPI000995B17B|nr:hypothetical protein [Alkalihalobacterium alkalinitrilicum]